MVEVPFTDIVTPDKMSGRGPATVNLTAPANPLTEERMGLIKFKVNGQIQEGEKSQVRIVQEAGEAIVVIKDFDYLVLTYDYGADDGNDLDTATRFTNTGIPGVDNVLVGYSNGYAYTNFRVGDKNNVGDPKNPEDTGSPNDKWYIIWGGDNLSTGGESCLIQMAPLTEALGDNAPDQIAADIFVNWYGTRKSGNVNIGFAAYRGGEMIKEGFVYVNEGGVIPEGGQQASTINVKAAGKENYKNIESLYEKVATMYYTPKDKSCVIVFNSAIIG